VTIKDISVIARLLPRKSQAWVRLDLPHVSEETLAKCVSTICSIFRSGTDLKFLFILLLHLLLLVLVTATSSKRQWFRHFELDRGEIW